MLHQRFVKRSLLSIFAVILIALALFSPPPARVVAQAARKSLIFVHPQEVRYLDPARVTESQSGAVVRNVYSRLVDISFDGTKINPDLAEKWEVSDDGLVYTFHLRQGVTFHDGSPLTADDVVYSFDRMMSIGEGDAGVLKGILDVGSTTAVDPLTVRVTLKRPFRSFLSVIGLPRSASILSKNWVKAHATSEDPWATKYLNQNANGTGPYKFVEWKPNEYVRMVRFDKYYKGPAAIEEAISQLSKDDTATRLALEKGDVDIVQRLPDDMMRALKSNPAVKVYNKPTSSSDFWVFNTKIKPFDDKRVRLAIAYAIDYDGLMSGLVKDSGVRMNSPVYNDMLYHNQNLPLLKRDLAKSKALLAEAGYPNGLDIESDYVDFGLLRQLAIVMQANLADANIRATVKEVPLNTLLTQVEEGTAGFYSWNSEPNYPHPDAILERFTTGMIKQGLGGNISFYSNPDYDALWKQIQTTSDASKLPDLYNKAQEMIMGDLPWLLLYQENVYQATSARVKGFDYGAFNYINLYDLSFQ
jgi:peptide/nickel transport system substrate-binding protein